MENDIIQEQRKYIENMTVGILDVMDLIDSMSSFSSEQQQLEDIHNALQEIING